MKRWSQFVPRASLWDKFQIIIGYLWWYVELRHIEKQIIEEIERHNWLHEQMGK